MSDEYWKERMDILDDGTIIPARHHIPTDPVEYARQLKRILQANPLMTVAELGEKISKSEAWIREKLRQADKPTPVQQMTFLELGALAIIREGQGVAVSVESYNKLLALGCVTLVEGRLILTGKGIQVTNAAKEAAEREL